MFKKFKDKLAEEMKQSPARLQASMQQLAQAVVSPALSNSSIQDLSASNENFSLTEEGDETPKNSPAKHGFQNVDLISPASNSMGMSRRSSVSSVTSDTSSLFPIYESPANLYHLQSDMDQSASEIDENINPQLEKVTKDQLYSAYRKVQAKYHKYRGRYTDLAAHYRELERVKGKLESVLVETQDKVLRRIADLKEQCQLEQQAKAHLEEALRNDIEEKDHVINTLNTKIKLLQTNGPSVETAAPETQDDNQNPKENLIDLTSESASTPSENPLAIENAQLKDKLKKLENLVLKYKDSLKRNKDKFTEVMTEKTTLESEYEAFKHSSEEKLKRLDDELTKARTEVESLSDQVNVLKKREEESVISLAENKLSIHRELEDKEEQIKQLRVDLKHMTETHENLNNSIGRYKSELEKMKQNLEAEKKEIIQDLSRGKSEAIKLMQQEMQQKLINLEEKMGSKYHEEVNRNKELTIMLEKLKEEIQTEKADKPEENEAVKILRTQLEEKESALQTLTSQLEELRQLSDEYRSDKDKASTELSNCMLKYKEIVNEVEAQKLIIGENKKEASSTIEKLQATIQSLDKELENMRGALMDRDKVCEHYNVKIHEYTSLLEKSKEKLFAQETEIKNLQLMVEDNAELSKLREELENKSTELLGLHSEIKSCKSTISDLKQASQVDRSKIELLSKQKNSLSNYILQYKDFLHRLKEDCANIKGNFTKEFAEQNNRISLVNNTLITYLTQFEKHGAEQTHEVQDLQCKLKDSQDLNNKCIELQKELADTVRLKSALECDIKERDKKLQKLLARVEQIDQLESKNCKLIAEVDNLNFKVYDLEQLCKESAEYKKELDRLSKELEHLHSANAQLTNERSVLKEKLEKAETSMDELREIKENFEQATETVTVLQSRTANYIALEEELLCVRSKVETLAEETQKKDDEIKLLNEKLALEQSQVQKLEAEYQTQGEHLKEFNNKVSDMEESNRRSTADYEARIAELTASVTTLQQSVKAKIAQLKKMKSLKDQQSNTIQELNSELDQLRAKTNEITTLQDNVADMSQELEQLKASKEQVTLENKDLKDKQNELLKINQQLVESSDILQTKADDYEKVNHQLLQEIQELQTVLGSTRTELAGQREYVKKIESQLANITTELHSRGKELMLQSEKLLLAEKGSQELEECSKKENDELRLKISELNESLNHNNDREERYREELLAAQEQCSKLKLEVSNLNESIAGLEQVQLKYNELVGGQESLHSKIAELESISSDKENLMSHVNILESKVSLLEETQSQNVALRSELNALKSSEDSKHKEFMSQISSLNVNNNSLTAQLEKLKHASDEKDVELKVLAQRNSELLVEIDRLKESHKLAEGGTEGTEPLKETIKRLEEDLNKKHSELESTKEANNKLQKELQNAFSTSASNESLIANINKLEEANKKLEAHLDEALITFQAKESQMQIVNNELKSETDKLRDELKTTEEEQSMRLKQLVKEFQAQLHDKEEELQAALEKRFDRQQNYESTLVQQYKEQLKDFQVELTAKSEQIERLILENKELVAQKSKNVDELTERIGQTKKEHADEIKQVEENWKVIMQRRTEKLRAKHEDEVNEILRGWREDRKNDTSTNIPEQELESTSRVAMAAVQSNTGSFHTLQQTLTTQRRELAELRKLVKLRHETLEDSTEIEYLRNILFEYMMGRETMVLARVIAAVVKFDEEQTSKILKKEEDKMTLLGSLRLT